jgi:hypothetical protein
MTRKIPIEDIRLKNEIKRTVDMSILNVLVVKNYCLRHVSGV